MINDSHQQVFFHGSEDRGLVADIDTHGISPARRSLRPGEM
jgi:hypothetical protein